MINIAVENNYVNIINENDTLKPRKIKISDWIKYDPRSKKEKAMILFKSGKNIKAIARALNLDLNKLSKWIFNYYENLDNNKIIEFPKNDKFNTPDNYSSWNSNIIYEFWNKSRKKLANFKS
jgi:hypothetical protein